MRNWNKFRSISHSSNDVLMNYAMKMGVHFFMQCIFVTLRGIAACRVVINTQSAVKMGAQAP